MILKIKAKINSNNHFKEIVKGGIFTFVAKILSMGLGLITSFVIARYYGADIIGIVAIINSVMAVFTIIGIMGTNTAILRLIPEYRVKFSDLVGYAIYKQILAIVFVFSVVSGLLLFISSSFIANYIFKKEYLHYFLLLAAFFVVVQTVTSLNIDLIRAFQKIKLFAKIQLLPSLITLILLLLITFLYYNKYNPIYVMFLSSLLLLPILFILIYRLFKNVKKNISSPITKSQIISLSFPMFLTGSMHLVISQTDTIMLGIMRSETEVGIYAIAMKLALLTSFILTSINTLAAPKFSQLYHAGKIDDLKEVAQKSSKLIFWTTFPLILIYILGGYYILRIFGEIFTLGYFVLIILAAGQFVNSSAGSVGYFLDMTGNQNAFRNIVLLGGGINIFLNIVLIPKFGIEGAAIASMVSISFWNIFASLYIKKKFGFSISYIPFKSRIIK